MSDLYRALCACKMLEIDDVFVSHDEFIFDSLRLDSGLTINTRYCDGEALNLVFNQEDLKNASFDKDEQVWQINGHRLVLYMSPQKIQPGHMPYTDVIHQFDYYCSQLWSAINSKSFDDESIKLSQQHYADSQKLLAKQDLNIPF